MISIANILSPSAVSEYFREELTSTPSRWEGRSADHLAISGSPVTLEGFIRAAHGLSPEDGISALAQVYRSDRRSGSDWVLSPSKSISIAALVSPHGQTYRDAYATATQSVLTFLETKAATNYSRQPRVETKNILAARIHHALSRHGDPHLHTHLEIFNTPFDSRTSQWRNLETFQMFKQVKQADQLLNAELYTHLRRAGIQGLELDQEGRCFLPGLTNIEHRFSKAQDMIDQKANEILLREPVPPHFQRALSRQWANDRYRPNKPKGHSETNLEPHIVNWNQQLTDKELANLEEVTRPSETFNDSSGQQIELLHQQYRLALTNRLREKTSPLPCTEEIAAHACITSPGFATFEERTALGKPPRKPLDLVKKRRITAHQNWKQSTTTQTLSSHAKLTNRSHSAQRR